jgi:hypothetical protein
MKFFILAGLLSILLVKDASSHDVNTTDQLIHATQHKADELFHEEITKILGENEHILDRILVPAAVFENATTNVTHQRLVDKREAALSSHDLHTKEEIINATQHKADELFHEEITKILGEKEHILDRILVPSSLFENAITNVTTLQRLISKRQVRSSFVPQSPLALKTVVQLASQS